MKKILLALGIVLGLTTSSIAVNYDPNSIWDEDPEQNLLIKSWIQKVKINGCRENFGCVSCCGEGDAYIADKIRVDGGGNLYVTITDARVIPNRPIIPVGTEILVPPEKIDRDHQGNPSGHTIIFIRSTDMNIFCFFPNISG
jgi:hypothetical protein